MANDLAARVKDCIRDIPDFPEEGVLFKDITTVLAEPALFREVVCWFVDRWKGQGIDCVVGMESRGFIFGAAIAMELGAAFAPARKKGKLPFETVGTDFELEYGSAHLEIHVDAFEEGDKVLIVDDLLATGGTAAATIELVERLGGEIAACEFVIELAFLEGRDKLQAPVNALVVY